MVRKAPGLIAEVEACVASHFAGSRLDHPLHGVVIAASWRIRLDRRGNDPEAIVRAYEGIFASDDVIYLVDHGDIAGGKSRHYLRSACIEQSRELKYTASFGVEFLTVHQTFFRTRAENFVHRKLLLDSASGTLLDAPYVIHSTRSIIARSLRSSLSLYAPASETLDPVRHALPEYIFQDERFCG